MATAPQEFLRTCWVTFVRDDGLPGPGHMVEFSRAAGYRVSTHEGWLEIQNFNKPPSTTMYPLWRIWHMQVEI